MITDNYIAYDLNRKMFKDLEEEKYVDYEKLPLCVFCHENKIILVGNGSIEATFGNKKDDKEYPEYPWEISSDTEIYIFGKGVKYINERFAGMCAYDSKLEKTITAKITKLPISNFDEAVRSLVTTGQLQVKLYTGKQNQYRTESKESSARSLLQVFLLFGWCALNNSYFTWLMLRVNPIGERNNTTAQTMALLFLVIFCFVTWIGGWYVICRCVLRIYEMPLREDFLKNYYVPDVSAEKKRKQLLVFIIWSFAINALWFIPTFIHIYGNELSVGAILLAGILPYTVGMIVYILGWHLIRLKMLRSF